MNEPQPIDDPAALGAWVRHLRKEQALTQEELALVAGVGRRFLIDLENGKPTARLREVLLVLAALRATLLVAGPSNAGPEP